MYSYITQAMATERIQDLRDEAAWAWRGRQARQSGRTQASPASPMPDTFEDFLNLTAGPAPREQRRHAVR